MRISHKYKFIFLANPRTGSTTVRDILDPFSDIYSVHFTETTEDFPFYHHISARELKNIFEAKGWNWDEYKKFTVVRNPYDRVVSLWHHYQKLLGRGEHKIVINIFQDFVYRIDPQKRLHSSLKDFISDENGNELVNDILLFENLHNELSHYLQTMDISISTIPHLNSSEQRNKYRDYYNEDLKSRIEELYDYELKRFGYTF